MHASAPSSPVSAHSPVVGVPSQYRPCLVCDLDALYIAEQNDIIFGSWDILSFDRRINAHMCAIPGNRRFISALRASGHVAPRAIYFTRCGVSSLRIRSLPKYRAALPGLREAYRCRLTGFFDHAHFTEYSGKSSTAFFKHRKNTPAS